MTAQTEKVSWYHLLRRISSDPGIDLDLATGAPIQLPEVTTVLRRWLHRAASKPELADSLGAYDELDGLAALRRAFAERCSQAFDADLDASNVLVIPGVQAGLRYVQETARERRKWIFYPAGLEFPGAVDESSSALRRVGGSTAMCLRNGSTAPTLDVEGVDRPNLGAVIVSRPHNPTGRLWERSALAAIADKAAARGAPVVLDEAYALPFAPLVPGDPRPFHAPNVIHLYSFSKLGLAGERVGAVVAATELLEPVRQALRRNAICASRMGQYMALELIRAFTLDPELSTRFARSYQAHWSILERCLRSGAEPVAALSLTPWQGGPFLWCEWRRGPTSEVAFRRLLNRGVAVTPAEALIVAATEPDEGVPARRRGLRIGLGASPEVLERAGALIGEELRALLPAAL